MPHDPKVGDIVRLTCPCHHGLTGPLVWIDEYETYWVEVEIEGLVEKVDMVIEELELVSWPCPMVLQIDAMRHS